MTSIDDTFKTLSSLADSVKATDLSAYSFINDIGAKTLLIAAAGELEVRLCAALLSGFKKYQVPAHFLEFVSSQALERKFHQLFDWKTPNSNKFLSLFGEEKKKELRALIEKLEQKQSETDFMYVGKMRNEVVHEGLVKASIPNTKEEIYEKYLSAVKYVQFIEQNL